MINKKYATVVGVIIIVLGFGYSLFILRDTLAHRNVLLAWNNVAVNACSNTGMRIALETLHRADEILYGLDLGCERSPPPERPCGGYVKSDSTLLDVIDLSPGNRPLTMKIFGSSKNLVDLPGDPPSTIMKDFELEPPSINEWGANLKMSNLRYVNMSYSNLEKTIFYHADMRGVNLAFSRLGGATFGHANLERACLFGVEANKTRFVGTILRGSNMYASNFRGAIFIKTDLRNAKMTDADFSEANFEGADLTGANIKNSDFTNSKGITCDMLGKTLNSDKATVGIDC